MQKEILHEFAITRNGIIVSAKNAPKGEDYFCPSCKDKFILKNSGKTGRGSRRPHFAHNNFEGNCSYESYLHNTFKIKTLEIINEYINKKLPLNVSWKCNNCNLIHNGNFLIADVKIEHNMKECIPDIALFDHTGRVFAVIEIIYKHPPEEKTVIFYLQNKIILIQVNIFSEEALNNVENRIRNPTSINICLRQQIPIKPRINANYRMNNGVPRDFIDNPNKYYSKNGNIYKKRYWKKRR